MIAALRAVLEWLGRFEEAWGPVIEDVIAAGGCVLLAGCALDVLIDLARAVLS